MSFNQLPRYRDLDLALTKHPITGDIAVKTGDQAVIRSMKNLIFTMFYERPFHPEIGCAVRQMLFENMGPLTSQYIKNSIWDVITNFEPRIQLRDVVVQSNFDRNGVNVTIEFFITNRTEPTQISLFLERVR